MLWDIKMSLQAYFTPKSKRDSLHNILYKENEDH